jgi:sugar/nucleoside kinase (ribokinase family)
MGNSRIQLLADTLIRLEEKLTSFTAVTGFDGFIDIITRPIASGDSRMPEKFYEDISEFSTFLSGRIGSSGSIELAEFQRKLGGNAPIFSNALSRLGVLTTCIGAFGYPEIDNVFKDISNTCKIIPVAVPGTCTALEFIDGKIMLAINGELNSMNWDSIAKRAGIEKILEEFKNAQLIGLFNWSETPMASDIWHGIIDNVLPQINKNKRVIFDFSDCARRKKDDISSMLNIVAEFGKLLPTTVSLNKNETKAVCEALGISPDVSLGESGQLIRQRLSAQYIVLHFHDYCMGFSKDGAYRFDTLKIKNPVISTGAGDNFNAGLSLGLLFELPLKAAMIIGSMTASYYVAHGSSPDISELIEFMYENAEHNGGEYYEN